MRVTANTFPDTLVNQLGRLATRQTRLQQQAATGQRVRRPEDDPAAMRRVLDFQAEAKTTAQHQRNIAALQEGADAAYSAMKGLKTISDRASEIAVLADGLATPEELQAYAAEITELVKQGVQLANTKHRGDHLFAGTKNAQPPFVAATDANGAVTAVSYQGNDQVAESEIAAGVTLSAQVPGVNTSGTGARGLLVDSRSGADFFNHLISLQNHLLAADTASINATDVPQLGRDEENFILHFAGNGALQSRLEAATSQAQDRELSLENQISREADADLAQTLVRLSETQTAYQAALQSGATILSQSLLDYLR